LIADVKRVARKLGKYWLTAAEFREHGVADQATVERRFKGWNNAVVAAGLRPVKRRIAAFDDSVPERHKIGSVLALKVLKRDKFKCQLCGASPAKNPDVVLNLDHITSVRNGGKNEIDNLWVLCAKCNNKKGSKAYPEINLTAKEHIFRCKIAARQKARAVEA
jgi:hypothetical protein